KRYAFGVRLTVWLWLNQPNSAGKHSFSGNDKAVSLRDSIAQVGCLSGNRHHERTPSTRTQQEPNLALFFSWSFSRIEVLAHRATSMFIALQLSWHNPENVDEMYVKRHNVERSCVCCAAVHVGWRDWLCVTYFQPTPNLWPARHFLNRGK